MSKQLMEEVLDFITQIVKETNQQKVNVTFHGGEPLEAGYEILHFAIKILKERFGSQCDIGIQSNLWQLDDDFCQLFLKYRVDISTSLDGPEDITDLQRGQGYFSRTIKGIDMARTYGMNVGCIATFTTKNSQRWREVFDFFLAEGLNFSIHPAVQPLKAKNPYSLEPQQYNNLLLEMLDYYIEHRRDIAISSLDWMCQAVGSGSGKVCTFGDCLGIFLAVDPTGDIYSCQRFCGIQPYTLGNIATKPAWRELLKSPTAQRMAKREEQVRTTCAQCEYINYCKGGCTYNAWASSSNGNIKDPYCTVYRTLFNKIRCRLVKEMASEENIDAISEKPYNNSGHPLLKKGPLIELVREGRHPSQIARTAKRIAAAVELARESDIPGAAARLVNMGICRSQSSGEISLTSLKRDLKQKNTLNNLYIHITSRCQLECSHCYARADALDHSRADMFIEDLQKLIKEAKEAGFRQVVITGGEPLMHARRNELLNMLQNLRFEVKPMNIVLRTNLAIPLEIPDLFKIGISVDHLIVSVDGDEESHVLRRGRGTYKLVVHNLENFVELCKETGMRFSYGELSLAAVLNSKDLHGKPGMAVRELARKLGINRTRFRPLLPLGRAAGWDEPPTLEALSTYADPMELIEQDFKPISNCGLGQNLYVEPSGDSFPCHAYHKPYTYLGNVIKSGLSSILQADNFRNLSQHNVDNNFKCKKCEFRYLCGGVCRAWSMENGQYTPDNPEPGCKSFKQRASDLYQAAKKYLEINRYDEVNHV